MIDETQADGTTRHSIVWALPVSLSPSSSDRGRIVKAAGLGLASNNGALALGYFNSSQVELDRSCHVILIGNTDDQLRRFAELTGDTTTICRDSVENGVQK